MRLRVRIAHGRSRSAAAVLLSLILVLTTSWPALASAYSDNEQEAEEFQRLEPDKFIYGTSFISPLTQIFGDIYIGDGVFIASNTVLRAAPNLRVEIGSRTNVQDNVIVRALEQPLAVGRSTSLTHHAVVRNSQIEDQAFIGFHAVVENSVVRRGAMVMHGARVEGVEIPSNAFVSPGKVITTQAQANKLPKFNKEHERFKRELLAVNKEFAQGYIRLYETEGYEGLIGVGRNPKTSFNEQAEPQLASTVELAEFVRIVGDIRVGPDSEIGQRSVLRADEGTPITIGAQASIDDRVTFHSLRDSGVEIGDRFFAGDDSVIHGPLMVGDGVRVGEEAIVFRAIVEDNVTIGDGAVVSGPAGDELSLRIPAGTVIPEGAVITSPKDLEGLPRGGSGSGERPGEAPTGLPDTGGGGMALPHRVDERLPRME